MSQIIRPPTAFANDSIGGHKKRKQEKLAGHLAYIRKLPCIITGTRPVEAAHIRFADARYGKRSTGMQEKPDDKYVLPLSPEKHREQHSVNERDWWLHQGIDPVPIALALWSVSGDVEAGERIVTHWASLIRGWEKRT